MEYKFTLNVVKNIEANSLAEAREKARKIVVNNFGGNMLGYTLSCEFNEVMNDTNSHNKRLVNLINISYNYSPLKFMMIINTLAERDSEECDDKGVNVPIEDENDIYDYLMNVADDEDLKVIIGFVRPRNENGELLLYED